MKIPHPMRHQFWARFSNNKPFCIKNIYMYKVFYGNMTFEKFFKMPLAYVNIKLLYNIRKMPNVKEDC